MLKTPDIQIADIEKKLSLLWKQPQEIKQTKGCLFNLIIYAHESRRVEYLKEIVDNILDKFPCRIIFIKENDSSDHPYLHADASIVMSGQNASHQKNIIACDQITIEASKCMLNRVPFLVIPHIVPDLPVYLLWEQTPFEDQIIFPAIQQYATRIIFDSESSESLSKFCNEMKKNLDELKMDIMDINWALLSSWREIFSRLFDAPEKINDLRACESMTITYNESTDQRHRHPKIRAIYLQGWIAQRLEWTYDRLEVSSSGITIYYHGSNNQPVIVKIVPDVNPNLPLGSIILITIKTMNEMCYHLARKPNLSQIIIHTSSPETCELPLTLAAPNVHRGLEFLTEIFYAKLGEQYRQMIDFISPLNIKLSDEHHE